MTNGVLRGLSGLTKLHTLHIPDAYRITDAGLQHLSALTGALHLPRCKMGDQRMLWIVLLLTMPCWLLWEHAV